MLSIDSVLCEICSLPPLPWASGLASHPAVRHAPAASEALSATMGCGTLEGGREKVSQSKRDWGLGEALTMNSEFDAR